MTAILVTMPDHTFRWAEVDFEKVIYNKRWNTYYEYYENLELHEDEETITVKVAR